MLQHTPDFTPSAQQRQLLLVEDNPLFAEQMTDALHGLEGQWQVVEFNEGLAAKAWVNQTSTPLDLVLVDLGLPDTSGLEVIQRVYQRFSQTPIIVMTTFSAEESFIAAIRAGASGYLLKSEQAHDLVHGIQQVLQGNYPVSPSLARYLFRLSGSPVLKESNTAFQISPREVDLLGGLAKGWSYAQCADAMGISLNTVQSHIRNVYRKLNVSNQTQAINKARASGVIS
jgi:DNA-binding NarL/FixJ family response regulator